MTLMLHISLFERSFGENILSKKLFTSAQLQGSCSPSETSASSAIRERICWKPADGDSARWWEALGDGGGGRRWRRKSGARAAQHLHSKGSTPPMNITDFSLAFCSSLVTVYTQGEKYEKLKRFRTH